MTHFQFVVGCNFQWAKRQKRGYGMETISGLKEHKSTCVLCLVVRMESGVEFRLLHLHVYIYENRSSKSISR
jgi:polyphosphate kinase